MTFKSLSLQLLMFSCVVLACCHTWSGAEARPRFTIGQDGGALSFGTSADGLAFTEHGIRLGRTRLNNEGWELAELASFPESGGCKAWRLRLGGGDPEVSLEVGKLRCRSTRSRVEVGPGAEKGLWAGLTANGKIMVNVGKTKLLADGEGAGVTLDLEHGPGLFAKRTPREHMMVMLGNVNIGCFGSHSLLSMGPTPSIKWYVALDADKAEWPF